MARNSRPLAFDMDDVVAVSNAYYCYCYYYYSRNALRLDYVESRRHAAAAAAVDSALPIDYFVPVPRTTYDFDFDVRYFRPSLPLRNHLFPNGSTHRNR